MKYTISSILVFEEGTPLPRNRVNRRNLKRDRQDMSINGVELWSWRRVSFFPGHLYQPKNTFRCWELGFERYDGKTWMFLLSYYCLLPVLFRFSAFWSMSWLFLAKRLFVCHLCCHGAVAGAPSGSCRWSWGDSRDEWVVLAVKLITPTPKLSSLFCTVIFFFLSVGSVYPL